MPFMSILDLTAIAVRIRALIARNDDVDVEATADRLHVEQHALSRSIQMQHPRPSLRVIAAIVREYGVDPSWLVYGEYDATAHALALERGASLTAEDVVRLVDSPKHVKPDDGPESHGQSQFSE